MKIQTCEQVVTCTDFTCFQAQMLKVLSNLHNHMLHGHTHSPDMQITALKLLFRAAGNAVHIHCGDTTLPAYCKSDLAGVLSE